MTSIIAAWQGGLDPSSYNDNRAGLAGAFFECCLRIFVQLVKGPAKDALDAPAFECLRAQARRFSLWGSGFGATKGDLDEILNGSDHLKTPVLSLFGDLGGALVELARKFNVDQEVDFARSLQILESCKQIDLLIEQVSRYTGQAEDIYDDELGSSDSDISTSDELEELIKDIKTYTDCFLDLVPTLERPAKNLGLDELAGNVQESLKLINDPAWPYITSIQYRFPLADMDFVRRLGEANWQRNQRLRDKREATIMGDAVSASRAKVEARSNTALSPDRRPSVTTKSSFVDSSLWDLDPLPGSGSKTHSRLLQSETASVTSFALSFREGESSESHRHVPKLPDDHDWLSPFPCTICGDILDNIISQHEWKIHVFDDLRPYICSFSNCNTGINTFPTRRAWMEHEFTHRLRTYWVCAECSTDSFSSSDEFRTHLRQYHVGLLSSVQIETMVREAIRSKAMAVSELSCSFCLSKPGDTTKRFASHVGKHMQEVALAALPASATFDGSEDSLRSDESDMAGSSDVSVSGETPTMSEASKQNSGEGAPAGYNFHYTLEAGNRKALLIGINYFGQRGQLYTSISDVKNMSIYLQKQFNFKAENMIILTDDQYAPTSQPTRKNVLMAMHWLFRDARPNDNLFFQYAGHGVSTNKHYDDDHHEINYDDDEYDDDYDELIYPVDFRTAGPILEDQMHLIKLENLLPGVRLTATFDAAHIDIPGRSGWYHKVG